jgi:hypothetical protein
MGYPRQSEHETVVIKNNSVKFSRNRVIRSQKPGSQKPKQPPLTPPPPRPPLFPVQEDQSALTTEDRTITGNEVPCRFPCPTFPDNLQPVFENILPCIVAKCGHFRAGKGLQIANQDLKWSFPEIGLSLFIEMLSVGSKKGVIGDQNSLR